VDVCGVGIRAGPGVLLYLTGEVGESDQSGLFSALEGGGRHFFFFDPGEGEHR
jgi:hypothetical protein